MDNTSELFEVIGKCCSCKATLPQGGWWGWQPASIPASNTPKVGEEG